MIAEGSAFLDTTRGLLAADDAFRRLLALPPEDAGGALRRRAAASPELADFLAGAGSDAIRLSQNGAPCCGLVRVQADGGLLLRAVPLQDPLGAPADEYAMQAVLLARLAASLAHEVKNPLNAMALQLALLGDKIAASSEALASACASNLASLKNQIGRVNDVVRRYLDVADPAPAAGFDAGALLADTTQLFGHEARRRRIALACEASGASLRAAGDPARAARLLLGIVWRALAATPEGGRLLTQVQAASAEVTFAVEHSRGPDDDPALAWMDEVTTAGARDMGGRLERSSHEEMVRVALTLPKERPL